MSLKDKRREIKKFLRSKFLFLKLKLKILLGYRLRVCFFVQETQKWNAQSLYDKMAKSNIFEPFILVSPMLDENSNRNSYKDCIKFFQNNCNCVELGYDDNIKSYIDIKKFKPDIVFFQQPWQLHNKQNPKHVSKFAFIYYFSYAICDSPNFIKMNYNNFFVLLKKYFIFNQAEVEEIKNFYKARNLAIVGHPKLDIYDNYSQNNSPKNTIIFAPHHSLHENSLYYSTFDWSGKYMLEWAKSHLEFKYIFKPHPWLKFRLIQTKRMTEEEVENYYQEWAKIGECCDDGDYFDIFMNSRCLITDCGSFLSEYLPTKQPVIHLRNKKAINYSATNRLIMQRYYKAYNAAELEKLLDEVLIQNNDYKKLERLEILETLNIQTNASTKIINEIKKDLNMFEY